jgi:hypothetical protein
MTPVAGITVAIKPALLVSQRNKYMKQVRKRPVRCMMLTNVEHGSEISSIFVSHGSTCMKTCGQNFRKYENVTANLATWSVNLVCMITRYV